jgi:hypothetical protein
MSQAGTIRLTVLRKDAESVGLLVVRRAKRLPLGHTPLRDLPAAGDRLLKASRRKRDGSKEIAIWAMPRAEAKALFHYLSFFFWLPWPGDHVDQLLSAGEIGAAKRVLLSIAQLILAKPGPERQAREDAAYVVDAHAQRANLPNHVEPPDPTYARRMGQRIRRLEQLEGTRANEIPEYLQILMMKNYP